jgi:hypothetical protein
VVAPEKTYHPGDVIRVITASYERLASSMLIDPGLLHRPSRLAISQRNKDGVKVPAVVAFGTGSPVAQQVMHRVFLSFRPETLPTDVRTHGRQDIHPDVGDDQQPHDHQGKNTRDQNVVDADKLVRLCSGARNCL